MGTYSRRLEERGYQVTADERASHRNMLDRLIPVLKDLPQLTSDLYRVDAIDNDECEALNAAIAILRGLNIPLSLLKQVDASPSLKLPQP